MTETLLSICMPTYNFGAYIGDTIESIIPQLTNDVELVILDGGSTDSTEEIVRHYCKKHPNIHYHKRAHKGGIDRDIATTVSLSQGQYVWLFSSDDIMNPGAIAKVKEEIASKLDLYLCGHTVCGLDISKKYWEQPIFSLKKAATFDFSVPEQRKQFFETAETTAALLSFMGSLIFARKRWDEAKISEELYGICYTHAARFFSLIPQGLKIRYIIDSLLLKRGFNDSFMERGIIPRIGITINGYHMLAERFFDADEAFHVRRAVRNEFPLLQIILTIKSQVNTPDEHRLLNQLIEKLYSDSTVSNRIKHAIYCLIPVRLAKLFGFVNKYKRFFKRFKLIQIKQSLERLFRT